LTALELVGWKFRLWRTALSSRDAACARWELERTLERAFAQYGVRLRLEARLPAPPQGSRRLRVLFTRPAGPYVGLQVQSRRPLPPSSRRALRLLGREAVEVLSALRTFVASERLRQAARLHHGPAQDLAGALLALRMAQGNLLRDPELAQYLLLQSIGAVDQAMRSVRAAIHALRVPEEVPIGIEEAIRRTWGQLQPLTEARLVLQLDGLETLPSHVEETLTAVACEAVANAAKHARANRVEVRLRRSKDEVSLEVRDNGVGLPKQQPGPQAFGLRLMRDYVRGVGGRLAIRRCIPSGTRVVAQVPLVVRPARAAAPSRALVKSVRSRRPYAHPSSAG